MRGFSLLEVLVTSVILAVMIIALFLVLSIGQRSWISGDTNIGLRQEIARALIAMGREIKETRPSRVNIAVGNSSNSITFNIPLDPNNNGNVLDASGNIVWSPNISYSLNGSNQIIRAIVGGNSSVIANSITNLQFSRTQNEVIQINIIASRTSGTGQLLQDSDQIVLKLRN